MNSNSFCTRRDDASRGMGASPMDELEYAIKSNAPGYVSEVFVDKGDRIKKDQPLAFVVEDGVQQKFEQAKAEREQKAKLADEKTSPVLQEYDARISAFTDILN